MRYVDVVVYIIHTHPHLCARSLFGAPPPTFTTYCTVLASSSKMASQLHAWFDHARTSTVGQHAHHAASAILAHLRVFWPLYVGLWLFFLSRFIYKNFLYARYFSPLRKLPGPANSHWFMGDMGAIINEEPGVKGPVHRWHKEHGPVIRWMSALGRERVSFNSRAALKQILVDEPYNFPKPPFLRDLLGIVAGYGLLTLEDSPHQQMRRFMNNAFAIKYLQAQFDQYYPSIDAFVEIVNERIQQSANGEAVMDLAEPINACLLDIICETAFGYHANSIRNPNEPLAHSYHTLVNLQGGGNLMVILAILSLPGGPALARFATSFQFTGRALRLLTNLTGPVGKVFFNRCVDPCPASYFPGADTLACAYRMATFCENLYTVRSISQEMLQEKIKEAKQMKAAGAPMGEGKVDVLSLLVRANLDSESTFKMTEAQIRDQVLTFLGAGHETTASGMAWALWEMACHPKVQSELAAECRELLARNAHPGYGELRELKLLDAVVNEVLRLRPPTPATGRQCKQDCTVDGTFLPKGTALFISTITPNCDPELWGDDAEEFNPHRWHTLEKPPQLMTFIQGAHACIGRNMAVQEMKALLCTLVANFEFEKPSKDAYARATAAITMKIADGCHLKVRRRAAM